ncbi:MAG: hypothetical protein J6B80_00795 [Clostridia bacterium]|nr:hypothetical protein [Clostridia bacterium]
MLYNLRADIIYYKSGSDFELEFNLCGCCRMRLLTDKPSNKKAFVHSLARAVSRSRVILIAGPLFGADNTIATVAQALGTTTEAVDNSAYNIASDDEIEIIKGSLPLVASDGSFGGCIIESGPQTMILLTDNKTLRKNIMSNLIHPYVSELYSAELKANSNPAPAKVDTTAEGTLNTQEETVDIVESTPEIIEEQPIFEETVEPAPLVTDEALDSENEIIADSLVLEEDALNVPYQARSNDLSFDDLISDSDEVVVPQKLNNEIDQTQIILEDVDNKEHVFPEEYEQVFSEMFTDDINNAPKAEDYLNRNSQPDGYQFFNDDGEIMDDTEVIIENRTSRLSIATAIITAILLLSIIVLCYCIFSASANDGMAPAEYIRSVWQTVFG